MAAGDLVNDVDGTAGAGYYNFQPAISVTIVIISAIPTTDGWVAIYNGTNDGSQNVGTATGNSALNTKMGINNTNYLRMYSSAADAGDSRAYSGIQIT
tara:strand:- start:192 stop:485 length:294 start_codon:yes stop_codon:yes gene_type:complete